MRLDVTYQTTHTVKHTDLRGVRDLLVIDVDADDVTRSKPAAALCRTIDCRTLPTHHIQPHNNINV